MIVVMLSNNGILVAVQDSLSHDQIFIDLYFLFMFITIILFFFIYIYIGLTY